MIDNEEEINNINKYREDMFGRLADKKGKYYVELVYAILWRLLNNLYLYYTKNKDTGLGTIAEKMLVKIAMIFKDAFITNDKDLINYYESMNLKYFSHDRFSIVSDYFNSDRYDNIWYLVKKSFSEKDMIKNTVNRKIGEFNKFIADNRKKGIDFSAGNVTDGYHTFNELYFHRMTLFSIICATFKEYAWKSRKHHDGTMFDGMFIVGITTPKGQYSYHYDNKYWFNFDVKELENAPEWDGHKPEDVTRLLSLLNK